MFALEQIIINKRFLYAILSSVLVIVSARVDGLAWLAVIWMLPLLWAMQGVSPKQSAGLAMACGLLFWAGSTWWLVSAFMRFTDASAIQASVLYGLLCVFLALPYAVFAFLYRRFDMDALPCGPWPAAALLTLLLMLPSPIPGLPQHALHQYPRWLAFLDVSGISGLIFVSSLFMLLAVQALRFSGRLRIIAGGQMLLLVVLVAAYGQYRHVEYSQQKQTAPDSNWMTVGMIQPNLRRQDTTTALRDMTHELLAQKSRPDLVAWPEFPPAFSVVDNAVDRAETQALSRQIGAPLLLVSGYVYKRDNGRVNHKQYYNAAHMMNDGRISASYYKQQRVPFFEFLPGAEQFAFLRDWFPGVLRYQAGDSAAPLNYNNTIKLIPAICYEVIFPKLVREFVKNGGNLLVNPVSDTWFGESPGSQYHLSLAHFRTMEHRIPWVRVANSGISIAVEANGEVIKGSRTALNQREKGVYRVFIPDKRTLYSRYGDWFTPLLAIMVTVAWIIKARGKYNAE